MGAADDALIYAAFTGAPKGSQNALKHGRYTAEAIEERRVMSELLRQCRATMSASRV